MKVSESVRVAIHEAGHTVLALLFCPERINAVTVIPGTFYEKPGEPPRSYLGLLTLSPPKLTGSNTDLLRAQLAVFLGGYVAEKFVLGDIGPGATHDLIVVGQISQRLAKTRSTSVNDKQVTLQQSPSSDPEIVDAIACVQLVIATERLLLNVLTETLLVRRTLTCYEIQALYFRTRS